jgi:arylsulfatase A-like enzyme
MSRPNIILISIDTLRFDHLSCNGYHRQTTPKLDRIAAEGVQFTRAYSTAVWTPPAHASMFTGLYPSQHGVVDEKKLNEQIPTLAEVLHKNGYHTAGFVNNPAVGQLTGLQRGHETFQEIWQGLSRHQIFKRVVQKIENIAGYTDNLANKTNQLVRSWIKEIRKREAPFYLFIHYIEPHNPLAAPRPFKGKYQDRQSIRQSDMNKIREVANNPLVCLTDNLSLNEAEIALLTALYDEEIAYLDYRIGELYDWIRSEKLLDNTLLIITADHGEHLGEKGLFSHVSSLYEPIVHVPLVMSYPRLIEAGTLNNALVQLIDIMPTVLHVSGIDDQSLGLAGIPLLPMRREDDYHDFIIAEWEGRIPHFVRARLNKMNKSHETGKYTRKLSMIRKGPYKFIQSSNGSAELYNIDNDAEESTNLAEVHPDISEQLRKTLKTWQENTGQKGEGGGEDIFIDDLVKKRLQNLGYM